MVSHKKRILLVSQYFWPEDFRVNELVLGLKERGYVIEVLTSTPNYPSGSLHEDYKNNKRGYSNYLGIKVRRVPQFLRRKNKFSLFLNYLSFVASASFYCLMKIRKKDNFDLILSIQLSPVFSVLPAILCKRLLRKPLYIWVLDLWPESLLATNSEFNNLIFKIINKISIFIYLSADILLLSSKGFKEKLLGMGVHKDKLFYFPQWVESIYMADLDVNSKENKEVTSIFNKWQNKKIFLFAGNIGEAQDFKSLLLGFKLSQKLSDIVFLIVGDGRYKEDVQNYIKLNNLEKNIFILGRYHQKFMPYFYHRADFLVFSLSDIPIFSLTLPGKVQSYMSSGRVILAMVNGESSALIKEANCGSSVNSGDSHGFAHMLNDYLTKEDKELAYQGKNGRDYAKQFFEFNKSMDNLSQMIG